MMAQHTLAMRTRSGGVPNKYGRVFTHIWSDIGPKHAGVSRLGFSQYLFQAVARRRRLSDAPEGTPPEARYWQ